MSHCFFLSSEKGSTNKRKELAPMWSKSFSFIVDPFANEV